MPEIDDYDSEDVTITLNFTSRYIYQTGLVLLATWQKTLPSHVSVVINDENCLESSRRVITNSGFRDLIERNEEAPSSIHNHPGKIPIQPIVRGYSTERAINHICNILGGSAGQLNIQAFRTLLSELCENTFVHSEFEMPGYIAAHLHGDKCEIAIADSGIGILNSYLEGGNNEAKSRISHGASAIDLAIDGLRSSKPNSHYGYGLFIVRRLVEENSGRLTILSGQEYVNIERYNKSRQSFDKAWNGTFVGLLINLNGRLPLEEIYQEEVERHIPSQRVSIPSRPSLGLPAITKDLILANYGKQLLTRETGVVIRADLATLLSSGVKVKVILDNIDDLTPSVADECFGKLAESMGLERFNQNIILAGGQPVVQRLIEFVVTNRLSR